MDASSTLFLSPSTQSETFRHRPHVIRKIYLIGPMFVYVYGLGPNLLINEVNLENNLRGCLLFHAESCLDRCVQLICVLFNYVMICLSIIVAIALLGFRSWRDITAKLSGPTQTVSGADSRPIGKTAPWRQICTSATTDRPGILSACPATKLALLALNARQIRFAVGVSQVCAVIQRHQQII